MRIRTLAGVSTLAITAATLPAMAGELSGGVVVLSTSAEGALTLNGNGRTESLNIYVNSASEHSVVATGNGTLDTPRLQLVGDTSMSGNGTCTGEIVTGAEPMANPFASVATSMPEPGEDRGALKLTSGLHSIQPGYYPGGIDVSGHPTISFSPGVYMVGGGGMRLTGGTIVGENVTFVMLNGALSVSGQVALTLSPPQDGPFKGVAIYQPASNPTMMSLTGGSGMRISGGICAPAALLRLTGTSEIEDTGVAFGDTVVANTLRLAGNGVIKIGHDGTPQDQIVQPGPKLLYD